MRCPWRPHRPGHAQVPHLPARGLPVAGSASRHHPVRGLQPPAASADAAGDTPGHRMAGVPGGPSRAQPRSMPFPVPGAPLPARGHPLAGHLQHIALHALLAPRPSVLRRTCPAHPLPFPRRAAALRAVALSGTGRLRPRAQPRASAFPLSARRPLRHLQPARDHPARTRRTALHCRRGHRLHGHALGRPQGHRHPLGHTAHTGRQGGAPQPGRTHRPAQPARLSRCRRARGKALPVALRNGRLPGKHPPQAQPAAGLQGLLRPLPSPL